VVASQEKKRKKQRDGFLIQEKEGEKEICGATGKRRRSAEGRPCHFATEEEPLLKKFPSSRRSLLGERDPSFASQRKKGEHFMGFSTRWFP